MEGFENDPNFVVSSQHRAYSKEVIQVTITNKETGRTIKLPEGSYYIKDYNLVLDFLPEESLEEFFNRHNYDGRRVHTEAAETHREPFEKQP